jgi:5-(carboxyamino)imidazole ribonucleotide synthase
MSVPNPDASTAERPAAILPGATLGVLGGGQLGRMLAAAARRLGYRVSVWCPEEGSPAFAVADETLCRPYDDQAALERFAAGVDVVAIEFENLPAATLEGLQERVPVRPGPTVLRITQHRALEKRFLRELGVDVAAFEVVHEASELDAALARVGTPAVLKSATLGYDGKGQVSIPGPAGDASGVRSEALALLARGDCVLERRVDLALELSVIVARGVGGEVAVYPPFENAHERHVLDVTVVPARVSDDVAAAAAAIAVRVAEGLDLVGLACIECFLTTAGELLVNEIAPRPHNSGHVTIEVSETDQFEQLLRAVCGLPLGSTALRSAGAMANLLGDLWADGQPDWPALLALPGVHLHLYGKADARPGRKMGHVSVLAADAASADGRVRAARAALTPPGRGG